MEAKWCTWVVVYMGVYYLFYLKVSQAITIISQFTISLTCLSLCTLCVWPVLQTGVSRVIYNFAHEIIGLKNHWGYQCVNLYYQDDKGCPLDRGNSSSFLRFTRGVRGAVGHFV